MGRNILRQLTQIRASDTYDDSVSPSLANYETNPSSVEDNLNHLRSAVQNLLNRSGASFPTGNWYDDLTQPTTLENGTIRGVDAINDALHQVEKKRVLREVWKALDIYPGLDLAITLVNELKADYEAHRVLTAGPVHGAADTTNTVTSADATDLASAQTLANEIKTDYEAHRILTAGSVHGAADSTNAVTAADATNLSTLITLVDDLRTQYEAHRVLTAGGVHTNADSTNTVSASAVGSNVQVHVFTAAQIPTQTTAAIGAVTTLGTVGAEATTFGTAGLDEVAGSIDVSPKNLCPLVDLDTRDPILDSGGKRIYALFQTESSTDGSTLSGTTPNRAQVSFVVINDDGDDLELVNFSTTDGFNFASIERVRFEDLNEQDFLRGATVDVPAASTVTRQVGYDNQSTTPVDLTTNAILDLEGAGLEWQIRDDAEAILFRIIEGSAGSSSKVAVEDDVDEFDVDAVVSDFLNGAKFDTGAAGTTIDIGVTTANAITSGGGLELVSASANELQLDSGGRLSFTDQYEPAGWSLDGIALSDSAQEWTDFESEFGEASLLDAILQASSGGSIRKVHATCTSTVSANNDVSGPSNDNNLDTDLGDLSNGSFIDDYDIFVNGVYNRPGADLNADHDVYPGTSLTNGQLRFEYTIRVGDEVMVKDRAA